MPIVSFDGLRGHLNCYQENTQRPAHGIYIYIIHISQIRSSN